MEDEMKRIESLLEHTITTYSELLTSSRKCNLELLREADNRLKKANQMVLSLSESVAKLANASQQLVIFSADIKATLLKYIDDTVVSRDEAKINNVKLHDEISCLRKEIESERTHNRDMLNTIVRLANDAAKSSGNTFNMK